MSKSWKCQVNVNSLFWSTSCSLSFLLSLRSCQVDKIEFSDFDFRLSIDDFLLLNSNHEYTVGSWRLFVHISWSSVSVMTSFFEFFVHFINSRDSIHSEVLDIDSFVFIFVDLQFLIIIFKEIANLFIVELKHGDFDQEFDVRSTSIKWNGTCDGIDYVRKCTRNNTFLVYFCFTSFHSVCLPCSCLTICKYCSIITWEDRLDDGECSHFEDVLLETARLEGHIKAEGSFLLSFIFLIMNDDLSSFWKDGNNLAEILFFFFRGHWSASDCNSDALLLGHIDNNQSI